MFYQLAGQPLHTQATLRGFAEACVVGFHTVRGEGGEAAWVRETLVTTAHIGASACLADADMSGARELIQRGDAAGLEAMLLAALRGRMRATKKHECVWLAALPARPPARQGIPRPNAIPQRHPAPRAPPNAIRTPGELRGCARRPMHLIAGSARRSRASTGRWARSVASGPSTRRASGGSGSRTARSPHLEPRRTASAEPVRFPALIFRDQNRGGD